MIASFDHFSLRIRGLASLFLLGIIMVTTGCNPSPDANNASMTSGSGKSASGSEKANGSEANPGTSNENKKTSDGRVVGSEKKKADVAIEGSSEKAKILLENCIENYRSLKSYEDEAVLRVSIPLEKNPVLQNVPLKVAFERPNKLALKVSLLQSMWSSKTFESIVGSGRDLPFENQRLVRPLPNAIGLDWLLTDHLFSVLHIPNVGIPLSMELLLGKNPLQDLLNKGKFALLPKDVFDNVSCERVEIVYNEGRFVVWIDSERKLILRQELPIEIVLATSPPMPPDFDNSSIEFSVDMVAVRANHQIDWSRWSLPRDPMDMLVRRFIDPPPRSLPPQLGTLLKSVLLNDADNREVFDSASSKTPITLLGWIDNSNASREFVDNLRSVERSLATRGLTNQCQILLVSNLPADKMKVAMQSWNCDMPIAIDLNNELRYQCGVSSPIASAMIGREAKIHFIADSPQLGWVLPSVELLKDGVDLAAREIMLAVDDEARYASRLHRSVLDKDQVPKMPAIHQEIAKFPMSFHTLVRDWIVDLEHPLASAGGELYLPNAGSNAIEASDLYAKNENRFRTMTALDEKGGIFTIDQAGTKVLVSSIPIDLATNAKRIHIRPDPWTHNFVAVIPEGLPRFWYFVTPAQFSSSWTPREAEQIKLDEGESIESSTWAIRDGNPVLCLTTNKARLRIFDPSTQKFSSSKPDSGAVSMIGIIPQLDENANSTGWNSIWSDRAIDQLPGMSEKNSVDQLTFDPEFGNWVWGKGKVGPYLVALQKLESGETGSVLMDRQYRPLFATALSVRPEQCRILSATTIAQDQFYWLSIAPNRVLHLQTTDGGLSDQMSFGQRIFGATIAPYGTKLKLIVALEKQVSSWTVEPIPVK